jgi:hypothetical protein
VRASLAGEDTLGCFVHCRISSFVAEVRLQRPD